MELSGVSACQTEFKVPLRCNQLFFSLREKELVKVSSKTCPPLILSLRYLLFKGLLDTSFGVNIPRRWLSTLDQKRTEEKNIDARCRGGKPNLMVMNHVWGQKGGQYSGGSKHSFLLNRYSRKSTNYTSTYHSTFVFGSPEWKQFPCWWSPFWLVN